MRHYAGDVVYHTAKIVEQTTKAAEVSWLEKNNDTLDSGWLQQMVDSSVSTQLGGRCQLPTTSYLLHLPHISPASPPHLRSISAHLGGGGAGRDAADAVVLVDVEPERAWQI